MSSFMTPRGIRANSAGSLELEELVAPVQHSDVQEEVEKILFNESEHNEGCNEAKNQISSLDGQLLHRYEDEVAEEGQHTDDKQQMKILQQMRSLVSNLQHSIHTIKQKSPLPSPKRLTVDITEHANRHTSSTRSDIRNAPTANKHTRNMFTHCETLCGQPIRSGTSNGKPFEAKFSKPYAVASLSPKFLIVSDTASGLLRFVRIAESGTALYVGTVTGATWLKPRGMAVVRVDPVTGGFSPPHKNRDANALLVCDSGHHKVRLVTFQKSQLDGSSWEPILHAQVRVVCGSGRRGYHDGVAEVSQFNCPSDVSVMHSGDVLVADTGNHAVRRVSLLPSGAFGVSTLAGGWREAPSKRLVHGCRDGGARSLLHKPVALCQIGHNSVAIADAGSGCLRVLRLPKAGSESNGPVLRTVAGSVGHGTLDSVDGTGNSVRFAELGGMAENSRNGLVVLSDLNCIRVAQVRGRREAPSARNPNAIENPDVWVETVTGTPESSRLVSPRGPALVKERHEDGPLDIAKFRGPKGMCWHPRGLIVADTENHCLRILVHAVATGETSKRDDESCYSEDTLESIIESKDGLSSWEEGVSGRSRRRSRWDEKVNPEILQYHPMFDLKRKTHVPRGHERVKKHSDILHVQKEHVDDQVKQSNRRNLSTEEQFKSGVQLSSKKESKGQGRSGVRSRPVSSIAQHPRSSLIINPNSHSETRSVLPSSRKTSIATARLSPRNASLGNDRSQVKSPRKSSTASRHSVVSSPRKSSTASRHSVVSSPRKSSTASRHSVVTSPRIQSTTSTHSQVTSPRKPNVKTNRSQARSIGKERNTTSSVTSSRNQSQMTSAGRPKAPVKMEPNSRSSKAPLAIESQLEGNAVEELLKWNQELTERNLFLEKTLFATIQELKEAKKELYSSRGK